MKELDVRWTDVRGEMSVITIQVNELHGGGCFNMTCGACGWKWCFGSSMRLSICITEKMKHEAGGGKARKAAAAERGGAAAAAGGRRKTMATLTVKATKAATLTVRVRETLRVRTRLRQIIGGGV